MPSTSLPALRTTGYPVIAAVVAAALLVLAFAAYHNDKDFDALTAPIELSNVVADGTIVSVTESVDVQTPHRRLSLTIAQVRWTTPNGKEVSKSFADYVPENVRVGDAITVYTHPNTGESRLRPWRSEAARASQDFAFGGFLTFLALAAFAYNLIRRRWYPNENLSPTVSPAP